MHSHAAPKKRKAISPIIATIILIVLTVVAGGFIYAYAMGMLKSGSTAQSVEIQSDNLVVPSGSSTATWSLTIQNTGSVGVSSVVASLMNGTTTVQTLTSFSPLPVGPGQSASASVQITTSALVAGSTYTVQLNVTYANHATQTITSSVTATTF